MSEPIREIRRSEKNDLQKPKILDTYRVNNLESQAASGHKYHEVPKTEQARLEDQFRELERKAERLKKKGEEINQSFREQVDDIKRWRDGMTNYQPDQSSARDTNPFSSLTWSTNPFRSMVGNEQFSGSFTPKPEDKFPSFEHFDTPFREQRSEDSTHKSENFEDKRLKNELKTLMHRKFGDEIVKSNLLKNLGTSETNTEVTKIENGNPSVYRDGNTYFVTYDERNAQGYFDANKDLSKIRCQVDDGLLRELEAKEAYVKWDLPIVYRIYLEKPEGEAQILITDDEAAVGKRMKDGWAVREVIERQKGFSLVDVRKNELPSYNEIMSDGKKEKIQDKIFDWSHTENYEAPPPYPVDEKIASNGDMQKKAKIESEIFGGFDTVHEKYETPLSPYPVDEKITSEKRITYLAKKALRKVWTFLSGDKQQRIGLDNRQSGQWQPDLQGYLPDKKDKKSDILYTGTNDLPPAYPGYDTYTPVADTQKKAEIESKSSYMFDIVHEKSEASPTYYGDKGITSNEDMQKKAGVESQITDMFGIADEKSPAPPAYDASWLQEFNASNYSPRKQEFSASNYSPREQKWSGLSGDKKTKKTKNPIFRPLSWRRRVNLTSGLTILA